MGKFKAKLTIFFLLFCGLLFAQERGVKPVPGKSPVEEKPIPELPTTRALVVGISDYREEGIPDLRYAHVDASEMAQFLKSKAGGSIDEENIHFLSDEKATVAQIYSSLDWLLEESQPTDKVIIYFSGHGDVETKTRRQQGFFLAHDTPPTNYRIGALRIEDLNDYLETIAVENQAKVVIITDACRSGHLAGGDEGVKTTAESMADLLANEVKIMSCKPDELSLEGIQWGGGRGVFSYHLLDGLGGLADANEDKTVDLSEIQTYLESKVVIETDSSQIPNTVGLPEAKLFDVDEEYYSELKKLRKNDYLSASITVKGSEEEILAKVDTNIRALYYEFLTAVKIGYLLPSDADSTNQFGKSADELYIRLRNESELRPLFFSMKQKLVVALQDDAQRALNAYLAADPAELMERWVNYGTTYKKYPAYLRRAAELLGEKHILYQQILAKKLYFEGLILRLDSKKNGIDSLLHDALNKEEEALKLDTNAAYIYNELGLIYDEIYKVEKSVGNDSIAAVYDSLQIKMYREAMKIAPKWAMPYNNLGSVYLDNESYNLAKRLIEKTIILKKDLSVAFFNLGSIHDYLGEEDKAIVLYNEALNYRPNYPMAYNDLGAVFFNLDSLDKAEEMYLKALELDSNYYLPVFKLGLISLIQKDYIKSEFYFLRAIELNSKDPDPNYNLACIKSIQNSPEAAGRFLEIAIKLGFRELETIHADSDLKTLRESVYFQPIIDRNFPRKKKE